MDVTIHRGTKEVGGSFVEISAGRTRIIIDTGMPIFTSEREPFDSSVVRGKTPDQLIETGVLPKVPGLYTDGERPQAIFLSHGHVDHTGLCHLTARDIPVYASKGTSQMMMASGVFGGQQSLDKDRFRKLVPESPVRLGDITVTPFSVDHSAYDSLAFLIEAEGKSVLYSGDLRYHGRKPGTIERLVAAAKARSLDALIMEGTHVGAGRERGGTEFELEEKILGAMKDAQTLVLASFSPLDVDRLTTYYNATLRAGRVFVADAYGAFVMHLVSRDAELPHPKTADSFAVFVNEFARRRNNEKVLRTFEGATIPLNQILSEPQKYVMMFRPSMLEPDFGGTIPPGARCIYSYWQGYLKNPDWQECQKKIDEAGGDLVCHHVSGHIYEQDVVKFVEAVGAKTVLPIHTFEPAGFLRHFGNVTCLTDGQPFRVN
jgi:ribonuclease J